jgi:hypothetical protein
MCYYLSDLVLLSSEFITVPPDLIAATIICYTRFVCNYEDKWPLELEQCTKFNFDKDLKSNLETLELYIHKNFESFTIFKFKFDNPIYENVANTLKDYWFNRKVLRYNYPKKNKINFSIVINLQTLETTDLREKRARKTIEQEIQKEEGEITE